MNDEELPLIPPGPLSRRSAEVINETLRRCQWLSNIGVDPPVTMWDSAAGIFLSADVDPNVSVMKKPQKIEEHEFIRTRRTVASGTNVSRKTRRDVRRDLIRQRVPWLAVDLSLHVYGHLENVPVGTYIDPGDTFITEWNYPHGNVSPGWDHGRFLTPRTDSGTLSAPIDDSTLILPVTGYADYPSTEPFEIQIDDEVLSVVSGMGSPVWTVAARVKPAPHVAGSKILLLTEHTDSIRFDRFNAGKYLLMTTALCTGNRGSDDPSDEDVTDHYVEIQLDVNGGTLNNIGRVDPQAGNGFGTGWVERQFFAGDVVKVKIKNRYEHTYIRLWDSAIGIELHLERLPL